MGAQQTYQWGALYPHMIDRLVPFCGSAKTAVHTFVFLEVGFSPTPYLPSPSPTQGPAAALRADAAFQERWYIPSERPTKGLRAFARVYAGWGFSQAFYREKLYLKLGFASLEGAKNMRIQHQVILLNQWLPNNV